MKILIVLIMASILGSCSSHQELRYPDPLRSPTQVADDMFDSMYPDQPKY